MSNYSTPNFFNFVEYVPYNAPLTPNCGQRSSIHKVTTDELRKAHTLSLEVRSSQEELRANFLKEVNLTFLGLIGPCAL
jgi:hypothetical protein